MAKVNTSDLIQKYVWLIRSILDSKGISLQELSERWRHSIFYDGSDLARNTFLRHKIAVEGMFDVIIDCGKGYRYYIANPEILREGTTQRWLLNALSVSQTLAESKNVSHRILMESVPSAGDALQVVIAAMQKGRRIRIFYQKYSGEAGKYRLIEPYCVKLFERRWYVLAKIESGEFRTFSFDRIVFLKLTDETFEVDPDFDASRHFQNVIGIRNDVELLPAKVVLRAFGTTRYYLRDLPLHASQRCLDFNDTYADYSFRLVPNSDLLNFILSQRDTVKVLEPASLAEEVKTVVLRILQHYQ